MCDDNFDPEEQSFREGPEEIFFPASLKPGDKVAFLSPSSAVKEEYVFAAMNVFAARGYQPILMENAIRHESGSYSAPKSSRLMDIIEALKDPDIKAIFCTRGGYGACQLLANFSYGLIAKNPKWLIGFSDISALHAIWYRRDIASIHGPMAKHLATMPADDPCTTALFNMLGNRGRFDYTVAPHPYNRVGKTKGILRGGNLAVLNDLSNTPEDILDIKPCDKDIILFIEDISEPIYKINRILWRLYLSGTLDKVKGIIFGQFTDYRPDRNFETMEDMINDFYNRLFPVGPYPIVFNFPTGHVDLNYPLTEGAPVELEVTEHFVKLSSTH